VGRAIFDALSRLPKWITKANWDSLESTFHNQAREWSGRSLARRIGEVDLKRYQAALSRGLSEAATAAGERQAKGLNFEFDMDKGWDGRFLVCEQYLPASAKDDDWASEWILEIEGPGIPEFAGIYREYGFDRSDQAKGSTLYMIARTVAAMGRCMTPGITGGSALCIGYRGQNPIVRMCENSPA
jgi:hypothetical protein